MKLTEEDLKILNSKKGIKNLFSKKEIDLSKVLAYTKYEIELVGLQKELIKLQDWVTTNNKKALVLFEGRDAAGKGGAIRRITSRMNPRHIRIEALPIPTEEESLQWYLQRYINKLPYPGEMVFFDRSWYNRAILEPVNKFCSQKEYETFMGQVNDFEEMLVEADTYIIKFYFSISKEEQLKRFEDMRENPLNRWKLSKIDEQAQELWDEYTCYKEKMFEKTNTPHAPWIIIQADVKAVARIAAIKTVLSTIPYQK